MAHHHPEVGSAGDRRSAVGRLVPWPSALVALLGAWMLVSPLVLDHAQTGHGPWSDVLSGAALVAMALVRVTFPVRTALLGLVNAAVGVWLVVSPFAFQYPQSAGAVIANDLLVGIAVVVLAVVGTITSSFAWRPRLTA